MGCDTDMPLPLPALLISTHTSRVGCDIVSPVNSFTAVPKFLLTHPVWDVTGFAATGVNQAYISTHTSRVGCDADLFFYGDIASISTHTSRVGCDMEDMPDGLDTSDFYSHIPCGM